MSEWFDIVDENGNPTGETVEREYAHRNGIRHRTAHLWILRKYDEKIQILLQKRSANKDKEMAFFILSQSRFKIVFMHN